MRNRKINSARRSFNVYGVYYCSYSDIRMFAMNRYDLHSFGNNRSCGGRSRGSILVHNSLNVVGRDDVDGDDVDDDDVVGSDEEEVGSKNDGGVPDAPVENASEDEVDAEPRRNSIYLSCDLGAFRKLASKVNALLET